MTNWKRILSAVITLSMSAPAMQSAAAEATAPSTPAAPAAVHPLRQLVLVESTEVAQHAEFDPAGGFVVVAPSFGQVDAVELRKRLAAGENRPIEDKLLAAIAQVVELFFRQNGYPTATAIIPPQNIATGAVRVVVSKVNYPLKQIVIADTAEAAQALMPPPGSGLVVLAPSLAFFDAKELVKRLEAGRGHMIDETLLAAIKDVVDNYAHQADLPVAAAVIPAQDFSGGTVRIALSLGKIRNIQVEGNRWFSESLLREKLRIERGGPLRLSELDRAVTWTNASPYRHVKLHIDPVPNTDQADLIVRVTEQAPVKATLSYDNSGNVYTGRDRYTAALSYGNLWGRDHQLTYQFGTTYSTKLLQVHAFDYRLPLRWRHVLSFGGSYVRTNASLLHGDFQQQGRSTNGDLRYVAPFQTRHWLGEISAGLSFKETNNNLEFGGKPASFDTLQVYTGTLGIAALREDARGKWIGSLNFTGSPAEISPRATREKFWNARIGANPRFLYSQLLLQRNTTLAPGVMSMARAVVQFASTNLVPTEEFALGGAGNVRGYEDRFLSGDGGYTFTHELHHRLPSIPLGKRFPKVDLAGVFFWDYGRMIIKHPLTYYNVSTGQIVGYQSKSDYLASFGFGLRASLSTYFSGSIDYARQLEEVETPGAAHSRVHVKVTLAY